MSKKHSNVLFRFSFSRIRTIALGHLVERVTWKNEVTMGREEEEMGKRKKLYFPEFIALKYFVEGV